MIASGGPAVSLVVIGLALYCFPTATAYVRKVPNPGSVLVVNLFLGWTFVGWVVAMAMAARSPAPRPTDPA